MPADTGRISAIEVEDMLVRAFRLADEPAVRSRLSGRVKMLQRLGWPDTRSTDKDIRKGHTVRQCLRFVSAFALMDAHFGPTDAVRIAGGNENAILAALAASRKGIELAVVIRTSALGDLRAKVRGDRLYLVPKEAVGSAVADEGDTAHVADGDHASVLLLSIVDPAWSAVTPLIERGRFSDAELQALLDSAVERTLGNRVTRG